VTQLPIRIRLTLGFALAMTLVLAAVGLFVYQRVSNELLAGIDQTLVAQAHEETESGHVDVDTGGGTTYAQRFTRTGALQASQPRALPPLLDRRLVAEAAAGRLYRDRTLPGRRGEWRVLAVPGTSGRGVVVVARSLAPRASSLDHLRHELVLFLPIALLAACLGGYALTARALRPVELLRRRAGAVTAESQTMLPVPPSGDEISRLATTLNDMLARLHAAVEHERRFVADASHELRTPLSLLQTELELALRRPRSHEELEQALRSAAEETQRLTRLANDLLLVARADQGPLPIRRETVPAGDLLEGVAQRFEIRAASLGRELRVEPSDLVLDADLIRLEQALANLVENALIYGRGAVQLRAVEQVDAVELHVTDEGEGFPEGFRARAFDRFSRADEARGRGGSGLGLSIVDLVARAHGGKAGLRNPPENGADVWLSLPGARPLDPAPERSLSVEMTAAGRGREQGRL
jgi:two-component system, OmpR family, sensor kinase